MCRISNSVKCNIVPESIVGEIDSIFNYRRRCELIVGPETDYQFIAPAVVSYYFTDTNTVTSNYTIIDGNNIALPIQHKFNPNINIRLKPYLDQIYNGHNWFLDKGVYILTYYRVAVTAFNNIDSMSNQKNKTNYAFEHLINNINICKHYPNIKNDLIQLLGKHYDKSRQYPNQKLFLEFTFRTMTFVSEEEIIKYGKVLVPGLNIIIAYGSIEDDYNHPIDMKNIKVNNIELKNTNTIEYIILKNNPKVDERMFIKSGNDIIPIPVRATNGLEQEGCYKFINMNGITSEQPEYCKLDEVNKFGIFKTEEECLYNGNKELILEDMKFEHQKNKINFDNQKLEFERKKLKHESKMLKLSKQTDMAMMKMKLELEVVKFKNNLNTENKKGKEHLDSIGNISSMIKNISTLLNLI